VKICLPRLPGKPETDWCRVAQPAAGDGRGFYWLPHVNDEVLVAFERGVNLVRLLTQRLADVEQRVEVLLKTEAGKLIRRPLEDEEQ